MKSSGSYSSQYLTQEEHQLFTSIFRKHYGDELKRIYQHEVTFLEDDQGFIIQLPETYDSVESMRKVLSSLEIEVKISEENNTKNLLLDKVSLKKALAKKDFPEAFRKNLNIELNKKLNPTIETLTKEEYERFMAIIQSVYNDPQQNLQVVTYDTKSMPSYFPNVHLPPGKPENDYLSQALESVGITVEGRSNKYGMDGLKINVASVKKALADENFEKHLREEYTELKRIEEGKLNTKEYALLTSTLNEFYNVKDVPRRADLPVISEINQNVTLKSTFLTGSEVQNKHLENTLKSLGITISSVEKNDNESDRFTTTHNLILEVPSVKKALASEDFKENFRQEFQNNMLNQLFNKNILEIKTDYKNRDTMFRKGQWFYEHAKNISRKISGKGITRETQLHTIHKVFQYLRTSPIPPELKAKIATHYLDKILQEIGNEKDNKMTSSMKRTCEHYKEVINKGITSNNPSKVGISSDNKDYLDHIKKLDAQIEQDPKSAPRRKM